MGERICIPTNLGKLDEILENALCSFYHFEEALNSGEKEHMDYYREQLVESLKKAFRFDICLKSYVVNNE